MKKLMCFLIVLLLLPVVFATTCGDGNAQGNEECDGADLRGYSCRTLDHFNRANPSDYNVNSPTYYDESYEPFDGGELACDNNCKLDLSGCYNLRCGDGDLHGAEECDDGQGNSDSTPDACRTDCRVAWCGDDVVDSGEQCDDGVSAYGNGGNSDEVPGACRTDCSLPSCGDGVIDVSEGEECDDPTDDNCYRCRRCVKPIDDLVLTQDTVLCEGAYVINDENDDGVIKVVGDDITVRCRDVTLTGVTRELASAIQQGIVGGVGIQNIQQVGAQQQGAQQGVGVQQQTQQQSGGFFTAVFHFVANIFTGGGEDDAGLTDAEPTIPQGAAISEIRHGTGFLITGDHAAVIGCSAENYRTGFDVQSDAALIRNTACDNNRDMLGEGVGMGNTCDSYDWYDMHFDGCYASCDGSVNEMIGGCPTCPAAEECEECEECSSSTTPETEPEPQGQADPEPEKVRCEDGSYVEDAADCPEPRFRCADGSMVFDYEDCPSCPKGETMCDDGSCERLAWKCDPYICWDGSEVEERDDCPCEEGYKCDDGHCEDLAWMCDPYECWDGSLVETSTECPEECPYYCLDDSCVQDESECPEYCPGVTCENGACVKSETECPEYCPFTCENGACVDSQADCDECCKTLGKSVTHMSWEYNWVGEGTCAGEVVDDSNCQ